MNKQTIGQYITKSFIPERLKIAIHCIKPWLTPKYNSEKCILKWKNTSSTVIIYVILIGVIRKACNLHLIYDNNFIQLIYNSIVFKRSRDKIPVMESVNLIHCTGEIALDLL